MKPIHEIRGYTKDEWRWLLFKRRVYEEDVLPLQAKEALAREIASGKRTPDGRIVLSYEHG